MILGIKLICGFCDKLGINLWCEMEFLWDLWHFGAFCEVYAMPRSVKIKGRMRDRMFCEIKIVWDAILNLKLCEVWELARNGK
jgi:hypothetical protein